MPSLIDLRRRIRSVQNTQQITKAMKMVSAAKLRRAQQGALASRPYADLLNEMLSSVLGHLGESAESIGHPLMARREPKRTLVLFLSGEKGLCGAFNSNTGKAFDGFLKEYEGAGVEVEAVGKKAREFCVRNELPLSGEWANVLTNVDHKVAEKIAVSVIDRFSNGEIDAVWMIYNRFKSVLAREIEIRPLLPVEPPEADKGAGVDYIYEQPPAHLFSTLLPRYVMANVYQAMLESAASEHSARMTAMDSATRNAGEVLDQLTLHLNRVRQASITTELIEVVSGAAAAAE